MANIIDKITEVRILDGSFQYKRNDVWFYLNQDNIKDAILLTSDELAAINSATSPSASNTIITETDLVNASASAALATDTIDWSATNNHFTKTLASNTELFDSNLPEYPATKKITLTIDSAASETLTLPTYWKVISGTYDATGVPNLLEVFCENDTSEVQVDTISLTGTTGVNLVAAAGGLSKALYFDTDVPTSAETFVTNYAADYLAEKIVVTNSGSDLVFTSQYSGYGFTNPTIGDVAGDLDGSVVNTTPNGTGTAQVDTVSLTGTGGEASITAAGGLTSAVVWNTSPTDTATDFVTTEAAAYAAEGITVTSSAADIIFTASEPGTAFTSPVITNVSGDLDGTVANTQPNVAKVEQVDTVTLDTGTAGSATMGAAGSLTKEVVFIDDYATSAALFVTRFAADYLVEDIVVTNSGDDIVFTSNVAGTAFTSPTIANVASDLTGTVANTNANVEPVVWARINKEA